MTYDITPQCQDGERVLNGHGDSPKWKNAELNGPVGYDKYVSVVNDEYGIACHIIIHRIRFSSNGFLIEGVRIVIGAGLDLLGVSKPEKM